jgi:hypothetical protein
MANQGKYKKLPVRIISIDFSNITIPISVVDDMYTDY